MRKYIFIFLLFSAGVATGQDFNARVTVNHTQVQIANEQIFKNLEISITEFLNTRKWTTHKIQPNERIDINVIVNISSFDKVDKFGATLLIQASRPVYGSTYNTVIFNHEDPDYNFTYVNFQQMNFNDNTFFDNLTSVLGFYAYIIIGLEADSYELFGGTEYLEKANNVMINGQSGNQPGWNSTDGKNNRNRYWLIENLLNNRFKQFREAFYTYHRKGLDIMSKNLEAGRSQVTASINKLHEVSKLVPNSFLMKTFFNAKATEIVNIYEKALISDKNKIIRVLNEIDPANSNRWEQIKK